MFRLTKRSVEGFTVEEKDYLVWDRDVRGFGVRIYPSGKRPTLSNTGPDDAHGASPSVNTAS